MTPPRLSIELVPCATWYWNLRSVLSKAQWDALRQATYRASGWRCDICGGRGRRWPVECHEIWEYDEQHRLQILQGLTSLCPACHLVKHFGFACTQGREAEARAWLKHVNGWNDAQVQAHIQEAFALMQRRDTPGWRLDLTWLRQHLPPTTPTSQKPP